MPESTGYAVKNNAESTVADNPLTSGATTLHVAAGQGSRFPSTFPFLITIWDDVTHPDPTDDPNMEITECSARSTDALTTIRGKEETSGVEHANGSRVAMLITAGIFDDPTYGISIKLNGIEDNATADQTGAEIKTAYESEPNAFTDAKNTKLDGIEDNATADQTKADINALGINAGQVDGCDAGHTNGEVHKIGDEAGSSSIYSCILYRRQGVVYTLAPPTTDDYRLACTDMGSPYWAAPYTHPSAPACQAATSSVAGHATSTQISKLDGIAANANNYSHPSTIQCNANNYSHPSSRQCTSGSWAAASITGTLAVANGGTGVTDDSYDADKVDGCDAGNHEGDVYKISDAGKGSMIQYSDAVIWDMPPGTIDYQLTSQGTGALLKWAASSDLIFSDTHCPKCGKKFEDGKTLVLYIAGHNEVGDILTIPMHKECAEASKKVVTIKRKVMEDRFVFDELTGKAKVQRVRKMQKKTVTKKRMKKDVELDDKTGEFWQLEDGKRKKKITAANATEAYEEEIDEQIYKDVEFEI